MNGFHIEVVPEYFGTDEVPYDPSLDRIDVAMRAVVKLAQGGRKKYCEQVRLTQDFRREIQGQVRDLDNWRDEDSLFKLTPLLLGFALELLRLYALRTRHTRSWYYRKLEAAGGRRIPQLPEAM